MSCYLVQETDGTSRFTLENGSGFLLLEACEEPPEPGYGPPYTMGDRRVYHETIRRHSPDDDDVEAFIAVLLQNL